MIIKWNCDKLINSNLNWIQTDLVKYLNHLIWSYFFAFWSLELNQFLTFIHNIYLEILLWWLRLIWKFWWVKWFNTMFFSLLNEFCDLEIGIEFLIADILQIQVFNRSTFNENFESVFSSIYWVIIFVIL
jgi:hypothetical protein